MSLSCVLINKEERSLILLDFPHKVSARIQENMYRLQLAVKSPMKELSWDKYMRSSWGWRPVIPKEFL